MPAQHRHKAVSPSVTEGFSVADFEGVPLDRHEAAAQNSQDRGAPVDSSGPGAQQHEQNFVLGNGSFGSVQKVRRKASPSQIYALKMMKIDDVVNGDKFIHCVDVHHFFFQTESTSTYGRYVHIYS